MKKIIKNCILFLIQIIEKFEYRNMDLDESNPDKKIINTLEINGYDVWTDTGWKPLSHIHKTQPYKIIKINTANFFLEGADLHKVFNEFGQETFLKDLKKGSLIQTINGIEIIENIEVLNYSVSMFDTTVNDDNHRYYTNGILSHNTISAAISILHYIITNNDKTVMIVANKSSTVIEIVDKIKSIYMQLPFWLKPGVVNWNQRSIIFETCRLKTEARTKEPAIGFTIDYLYLDEFAHIPRNIIEPYYKAVYPTVASLKNSKIVITSTPNGFNMFHKLLVGAEAPAGSMIKNNFKGMRVYWWQVPGRNVTYVKLIEYKLSELGITPEFILSNITDNNWKAFLAWDYENHRNIITIENDVCTVDEVRALYIMGININELAEISTWKEDAIKDIGSEEGFNQEFGLQFIAGSKLLFPEEFLKQMADNAEDFKYIEFPALNKCRREVKELIWTTDATIFNPAEIKEYNTVVSIDCAEGLGQDYSVVNIFRCVPLEDLDVPRKALHDYFRLQQIGIYRSNKTSIGELAEILYVILFDILNPEYTRAVLEYNTYGGELLAKMPHLFDGVNEYGTYIWQKYKHRIDADKPKIGLKVTTDKRVMVEDYIRRMKNKQIIVRERNNIIEISTFVKDVTPHGNIKFEAESGNDDTAMTVVDVCTIFESVQYKDMCERVYEDLPESIQNRIDQSMGLYEGAQIDYTGLLNARRRAGY